MKRRNFLKSGAAAAGSLLLTRSPKLDAAPFSFKDQLAVTQDDDALWRLIRKQFLFPDDYTYLNTGGIGPVPYPVLAEVRQSMEQDQIHPGAGHDHKKWTEIKKTAGAVLSPDISVDEIALISTATEGINIIINGLPLKKGDEVITSAHEHPALCVPLLNRMQRDGIKIKVFEPDMQNGLGNVDKIKKLITSKTRLIFISHITCVTGQHFPIAEIGSLAKRKNIWFGVDGAQGAGTGVMDITDWNVDFYAYSGHKWVLGPKRTGVLYVRKELQDTVHPITVGAYSDGGHNLERMELKFQATAERYEFGTQNHSLFDGMKAGIDMVSTIGFKRINEHNRYLAEQFYTGLQNLKGVKVISPTEEKYRTSMITFKPLRGKGSELAGTLSGKKKIRVRHIVEADLDSVRVSFHIYNTEAEVHKILSEIGKLV